MNHYIYGPESDEPKQVRESQAPIPMQSNHSSQWQYVRTEKRSGWKTIFASVMAGAVLMGGLMFTADKYNFFTSADAAIDTSYAAPASQFLPSNNNYNQESGIRKAALTASGGVVRPNQIADMVQYASPAIVKVETTVKTQTSSNAYTDDPIFRYFFGGDGPSQDNSTPNTQPGGMGTGFIFEKTGYILTNQHVIEGADGITVTVEGYDKPFPAKLLGSEHDLDLAVLKIENTKEFPVLPLGSSDDIRVGDWVVAIGNPYGFDHTVTVGVLSAKGRPIDIPEENGQTRKYTNLLQTDASINPGNSGGPLLNLNGEVIGINTAVSAQAQGIGFAIPTSTITAVLDNLKNNIKQPKPYIGVYMQKINKTWVKQLGLPNTNGAFVQAVVQNSPAERAGLQPYDVIVAVNGKAINSPTELETMVKTFSVGTKLNVTIYRDGMKMTTGITVDDRNKLSK